MAFESLTPTPFDRFTDTVLELFHASLRRHCQDPEHPECFALADLTEVSTSNAYCSTHWYQHIGRLNLQVIRGAERGL